MKNSDCMCILFPSDPSQYDARDVVTAKKDLWYCSQFVKQARGNDELAYERMVGVYSSVQSGVSAVYTAVCVCWQCSEWCVCSVHCCVCMLTVFRVVCLQCTLLCVYVDSVQSGVC